LPPNVGKVVRALAKVNNERKPDETLMLMEFFTQANCFIELGIQKDDLFKVVQHMEYKRLAANEVIFNIGDVGDYFYILIHGKVQLLLPNPEIQGI
jgi:CRP-like cAMP-binding protein